MRQRPAGPRHRHHHRHHHHHHRRPARRPERTCSPRPREGARAGGSPTKYRPPPWTELFAPATPLGRPAHPPPGQSPALTPRPRAAQRRGRTGGRSEGAVGARLVPRSPSVAAARGPEGKGRGAGAPTRPRVPAPPRPAEHPRRAYLPPLGRRAPLAALPGGLGAPAARAARPPRVTAAWRRPCPPRPDPAPRGRGALSSRRRPSCLRAEGRPHPRPGQTPAGREMRLLAGPVPLPPRPRAGPQVSPSHPGGGTPDPVPFRPPLPAQLRGAQASLPSLPPPPRNLRPIRTSASSRAAPPALPGSSPTRQSTSLNFRFPGWLRALRSRIKPRPSPGASRIATRWGGTPSPALPIPAPAGARPGWSQERCFKAPLFLAVTWRGLKFEEGPRSVAVGGGHPAGTAGILSTQPTLK